MEIKIGASVSYFALNDQDTFAIGTIVGRVFSLLCLLNQCFHRGCAYS